MPAGSGQVFASAVAPVKGTKKKRPRTSRVGTGAAAQQPSSTTTTTTTTSLPAPSTVGGQSTLDAAESAASTLEEADKATQRAEDFMAVMEQQQSNDNRSSHTETDAMNAASTSKHTAPSSRPPLSSSSSSSSARPPKPPSTTSAQDEDEDGILLKAKAAAEAAQKLEQQSKPRTWVGGLFRTGTRSGTGVSRMAGGTLTGGSHKAPRQPSIGSNSSSHSGATPTGYNNNNSAAAAPPAIPSTILSSSSSTIEPQPTSSTQVSSSSGKQQATREMETPAERLQREQEEVQRNMAERQKQRLEILEQQGEPRMDGDVTSSSSSSYSYQPVDLTNNTTTTTTTFSSSPAKGGPIEVIPVPKPPSATAFSTNTKTAASSFSFLSTPSTIQGVSPVSRKVQHNENTPRGRFDKMMESFRTKVELSMEQVKRLRQHKTGLLEERFHAKAKERLAVSKKEQAEAQQMAAVEAEDFDLADRMNTLLDHVESERLEQVRILENIGRALQQLQEQKQSTVAAVTACFVEIQESLHAFAKEQGSQDSNQATDSLKKFEQISKQMSAEHERLQQYWKHLDRDSELVKAERQELEDAISEQAGGFETLRDQARERVKVVEQEMDDLRQELDAKQREVARLRTEAAGHDEAVLKVRVKFSRQLGRVQQKEMTLEDNREEWQTEQTTLRHQKEAHEQLVAQHQEAMLERNSLLDLLHQEVDMAETFQSIVAKEIGFDILGEDDDDDQKTKQREEAGDNTEEGKDEEGQQQDAKVVDCEAAVIEAKEVLQATETSLEALEGEQRRIEEKLPQLEELKNSAAAKRDFRAAGKYNKEIKESQSRLQELQTREVVQAQERCQAAHRELEQREAELAQEQAKAAERERQVAMTNMQRLAQHMARLQATLQAVCGGTTSNNNGDAKTYTIQSVGAHVLEAQMEALRLEGETYGEKYGGWEKLLEEAGLSETTKEEPNHETANKNGEDTIETSTEEHSTDPSQKADAMKRFRELTARLEETNVATEAAVAEEDYEKAAKLDETMQDLLKEIQALGLTDDEMALALATEAPADSSVAPEAEVRADEGPTDETKNDEEAKEEKDEVSMALPEEPSEIPAKEKADTTEKEKEEENESPQPADTDQADVQETEEEDDDDDQKEEESTDEAVVTNNVSSTSGDKKEEEEEDQVGNQDKEEIPVVNGTGGDEAPPRQDEAKTDVDEPTITLNVP